jgi:hypothetical protein
MFDNILESAKINPLCPLGPEIPRLIAGFRFDKF